MLAYRYGDASVLAPFSYTQLLWVSILGFFLFGELPDVWTVTARPSSSPAVSISPIASASAASSFWCWQARSPEPLTQVQSVPLRAINGSNNKRRSRDARCHFQERRDRRRPVPEPKPGRRPGAGQDAGLRHLRLRPARAPARPRMVEMAKRPGRNADGSVARRRVRPRILLRDPRLWPRHRSASSSRARVCARCRRC